MQKIMLGWSSGILLLSIPELHDGIAQCYHKHCEQYHTPNIQPPLGRYVHSIHLLMNGARYW